MIQLINSQQNKLNVIISKNNIQIQNSYKIHKEEMNEWLNLIRQYAKKHFGYVYKRKNQSWIAEWSAHNFLYNSGIQQARTTDVDLNKDEKFLYRYRYQILSSFYK